MVILYKTNIKKIYIPVVCRLYMVKHIKRGFLKSLILSDEEKRFYKFRNLVNPGVTVNKTEKILFKRYAKELKILDKLTKI